MDDERDQGILEVRIIFDMPAVFAPEMKVVPLSSSRRLSRITPWRSRRDDDTKPRDPLTMRTALVS